MIILGIDPGSRRAGFGVIKVSGRKFEYLDSGVMKYDHEKTFLDRLGIIYTSCEELVEKYQPDHISCESLIYVKSIPALSKLAQARGSMIAAFMKSHQGKVFEYSPNLIKTTVSGHGHADKTSIEKAMMMLFGNKIKFETHDASDALATAVCHGLLKGNATSKRRVQKKGPGSLKSAFKHLERKI